MNKMENFNRLIDRAMTIENHGHMRPTDCKMLTFSLLPSVPTKC